ncbi:hypothetical protein DFP72DRAFT_606855 [Ephemerocybe angulata]|uniref:Uncharacterized protein n=1 Tax=Ephemerocybe angulata TaxID=980116 RepID=A0A8H6HHZ9_9AGAR|nr:hypothetical protein DFP72DRAFT_606855 [Tulosesus angulatus]
MSHSLSRPRKLYIVGPKVRPHSSIHCVDLVHPLAAPQRDRWSANFSSAPQYSASSGTARRSQQSARHTPLSTARVSHSSLARTSVGILRTRTRDAVDSSVRRHSFSCRGCTNILLTAPTALVEHTRRVCRMGRKVPRPRVRSFHSFQELAGHWVSTADSDSPIPPSHHLNRPIYRPLIHWSDPPILAAPTSSLYCLPWVYHRPSRVPLTAPLPQDDSPPFRTFQLCSTSPNSSLPPGSLQLTRGLIISRS